MPPPPPASGIASRLFLGPALRAQPDRRLVGLVRDGYEAAFEEIVRRYDRGLRRYAAAIVPSHRADDVTQDTLQKALLALRSAEDDVELRPWLFRILRNTALNDLRDQPPPAQGVPEYLPGTDGPVAAAERREEIADLMKRLRALPEPQRAAIVMRELEGLSHEEIAAALGITGGAARQMLYRARRALRNGAEMLTPLPLLHYLLAGAPGGAAASEAATGAGLGAAGLAGGGAALKAGVATVIVAGSVGAGVVVSQRDFGEDRAATVRIADSRPGAGGAGTAGLGAEAATAASVDGDGSGSGASAGRHGSSGSGGGGDRGGKPERSDDRDSSGPGSGDTREPEDHSGPGHGGQLGPEDEDNSGPGGGGHSGPGGGGGEPEPVELPEPLETGDSPNSGSGSISSGSGSSGSRSGSGSSGSGSSGSGSSGSGSSGSGDGSLERSVTPDR
jgi:RNA polymerase sigma factor (sigma-70 family)